MSNTRLATGIINLMIGAALLKRSTSLAFMVLFLALLVQGTAESIRGQERISESRDADRFVTTVLSDFGAVSSRYLALKISTKDFSGKVVIPNGDLYLALNAETPLSESEYIARLRSIIKSDSKLKISSHVWKSANFRLVDDRILGSLNHSPANHLIEEMFAGGRIRPSVRESDIPAVIWKLFGLGMATRSDDETGTLLLAAAGQLNKPQ